MSLLTSAFVTLKTTFMTATKNILAFCQAKSLSAANSVNLLSSTPTGYSDFF